MPEVAALLVALNAYSAEQLEEADYDVRLEAYNALAPLIGCLRPPLALPLLCHCIFDLEADDIALKHSASHHIALIVRHGATQTEESGWSAMLAQVLMPALRRGLRLPVDRDQLRQDFLRVLAATLLEMPT